jgi:hypothetical protein
MFRGRDLMLWPRAEDFGSATTWAAVWGALAVARRRLSLGLAMNYQLHAPGLDVLWRKYRMAMYEPPRVEPSRYRAGRGRDRPYDPRHADFSERVRQSSSQSLCARKTADISSVSATLK